MIFKYEDAVPAIKDGGKDPEAQLDAAAIGAMDFPGGVRWSVND